LRQDIRRPQTALNAGKIGGFAAGWPVSRPRALHINDVFPAETSMQVRSAQKAVSAALFAGFFCLDERGSTVIFLFPEVQRRTAR
jgi:hypothetical protein